jgi:hypothetical protein
METNEPFMTRAQLHAFLNQEVGMPIGMSTLEKLCIPSVGDGPPVAAWWNKRPLYRRADARAWAEKRMKPGR